MEFKYLEHTADAEFIAYGRTLDEAFANAARAMFGLTVDLSKVRPVEAREITLTAGSPEDLLFDWLSELLYLSDVDRMVFSQFDVQITRDGEYWLNATARGEKIAPRHEISLNIKAVTYHDLRVEKRNNAYEAQVLLDI
jgi:SHS2 domain-containing protein